jgi:hypothetical protein
MEVLSLRVPKELKKEMSRLDVDWAEYVRQAIEQKIRAARKKRASRGIDELRRKTKGVEFDSVKLIREARDSR